MNTDIKKTGRLAVILCGLASLVLLISACSSNTSREAGSQEIPVLPACEANVMADTKSYINKFTNDRVADDDIRTGYDGSIKLASQKNDMAAISKAAMLPCIPDIDINNSSANPENVQTIQSAMNLELWSKIVLADRVGMGDGNAPKPSGFSNPSDSYKSFLTVAGRFPYFCGEKGEWDSPKEACQRELSTMFAHAIQETGEKPVPAGEELWQTSLFFTREVSCYPNNCTQYNGGAASFGAPSDVSFYGRGMKQLSYAYNYAAFSASYYGDMSVLINDPDLVATNADLVLGSGIWFAMSPQPPKPSMHDVVIGSYEPQAAAKGITVQGNGSVVQKFSATVSIINGAIECSPMDGSGSEAARKENLERSKNRFINYKALLPVYGVPEKDQSANEKEMVPGKTYCEIANGPAFDDPKLSYKVPFYLDAGSASTPPDGTCFAVSYGQAVTLPVSAPGMYKLCQEKYRKGGPIDGPTSAPSGSPTATDAPTAAPTGSATIPPPIVVENSGVKFTTEFTGVPASWGYCMKTTAQNDSNKATSSLELDVKLDQDQSVSSAWGASVGDPKDGEWPIVADEDTRAISPGQARSFGFCVDGGGQVPSSIKAEAK